MKIVWFTWKDRKHPAAGGAEVVNEELARRFVNAGHEVVFIVGGFPGGLAEEVVDNYRVVRLGNRWTVYPLAWWYYRTKLVGWADVVIDEINTLPFFCKFYVREKNILLSYQLCREVWFYQAGFPLSLVGYALEPLYLWLLRDKVTVTVSRSTKEDLIKYGFADKNIHIVSVGNEIEPVDTLATVAKYERPTILSLGVIRPMKRTDHIISAFELAKTEIEDLQLVVAGDPMGSYGERILKRISESPYRESIRYVGKVDREGKIRLLRRAHVVCVTSVKEGWGLVVTAASGQGTPAVVYNVDGLRDSVIDKETGLVCERNAPESMAANIIRAINDKELYEKLQEQGWERSRTVSFEKAASEVLAIARNVMRDENR